jgi:predicted RNA binding protein YcfA (HicA-like mRNA interferase family)
VKLPRDISGRALAKALEALGYLPTRQTGSHLRLTTQLRGQHHVTVPAHASLRVGTIAAVLDEVAKHHALSREQLVALMFGRG